MGNAIQFGIYRGVLAIFSFIMFSSAYGQDYYVDLQGDTQKVEITKWFFNHFFYQDGTKVNALFTDDVQSVYRSEAETTYMPYSAFSKDSNYVDFFIPTIGGIRNLSTDFFKDENFEVWVSGQYMLYEIKDNPYSNIQDFKDENAYKDFLSQTLKFDNERLFKAKDSAYPVEIPKGIVLIYHDSVGLNKIVSEDIEEDYFKLLLSRYTFNATLNDSIFGDNFKLKPKNFIDFFDSNISALTQVLYSDKDMAEYYIASLHDGALIVLLNLDMRKIELYRNSGNTELADELEEKLLKANKSMAISFLDTTIFSFCKVYIADAKSRSEILEGVRENIFLNAELEVDSSISLQEDFFLFARRGQVFETQLIDQSDPRHKRITSNPVVQDALVIYDHKNVQIMDPFPMYVREASLFSNNIKSKKQKNLESKDDGAGFDDEKSLFNYLVDAYNYPELEKSKVNLSLVLNNKFIRFYNNSMNVKIPGFRKYLWKNERMWINGLWQANIFHPNPEIYHNQSILNR